MVQRRNLGCPNEPEGLADFGLGQGRQKDSKGAGIDHFGAEMGLADLVAHDDSRPPRNGANGPHGVRPRQIERSSPCGLDKYRDYGA